MVLFQMLRRALAACHLVLVRIPARDSTSTTDLLYRLAEDSADGRALRHFLRPYLTADRPIIERFAGTYATLSVEGPVYVIDGVGMPLGGQIKREGHWLDCYPAEVNEIVGRMRAAIDDVLHDWLQSAQMQRRLIPFPPERMRPSAGETAIMMMKLRAPSSSDEEHAADDR